MSNLEPAPVEVACHPWPVAGTEVLHPREVPLGGPRAIRVPRTLPQRQRSLIGAWCFIDHYGPVSARIDVPPHPHTGLQTVSWLFSGEVEHRDSAGVHAVVGPGELNLMTAGAGICHAEVSAGAQPVLHGVQLWVALPASDRDTGRDFAHYAPTPRSLQGAVVWVFLGELAGSRSPVHTFTPLLGAQIDLDAGTELDIDVDPAFEHGVLCHLGLVDVDGTHLGVAELAYRSAGQSQLHLRNAGDWPARVLLLGGTPFAEELVMWWNFVGPSHDDIVRYRRLWEDGDERLGAVRGYRGSVTRLPAPPLPTTRLRPRPIPQRKEREVAMTADKTGAETTVRLEDCRYTIAVEGKQVGLADFADRGDQRVFFHTEIDPAYGGRGLATILLEEALNEARDEGKRIVPVCSMIGTVLKKHPEYDDITDPVTADVQRWLQS